mgnify:CR=1 FL=1
MLTIVFERRINLTLAIALLRTVYLVCITLVALYAAGTFYIILLYLRHARTPPRTVTLPDVQLPKVTVQIPLYNERYVARRAIEAAANLDYPRDRLHVQILDDSTDDTTELIQGRISQLRSEGLSIELIHRRDRKGYKAGALANGMLHTDGAFIAIFDADFIPPRDFLKRTVPYFSQDEKLGLVQTRWGHLNDTDNLLTRSQALALDSHFGIEQFARSADNMVMSFNGTGGVWRRTTIEEAGGWQADTLTEDFDLSYRAQLKGWHFMYARDVVVPGEIPAQMSAYKHQQARWAKGSTQVLLKMLLPLLRSKLTLRNRIMGTMHLMQYTIQLVILAMLLLTPPMILLHAFDGLSVAPFSILALSAPIMYVLGQYVLYKDSWWRRVIYFPALLIFGNGMSFNNGRAAISALLRHPSEFKRTPKFHLNGTSNQQWTRTQYAALLSSPDILGEVILGIYSIFGTVLAMLFQPSMILYMAFYVISYFTIVVWSLWDRWLITRPTRSAEQETIRQAGR